MFTKYVVDPQVMARVVNQATKKIGFFWWNSSSSVEDKINRQPNKRMADAGSAPQKELSPAPPVGQVAPECVGLRDVLRKDEGPRRRVQQTDGQLEIYRGFGCSFQAL
ncbi:hypothetical protein CDAR_288161 [Caerostris darwini]|uniref:Uncharacterized protein n=1 Tax=Caerostris darwini TaxID=1538125 RepID=A0AAV4W8K4_9ARAC|nr:hypothetical protein CDAR_288161 [Caerostris darwini]